MRKTGRAVRAVIEAGGVGALRAGGKLDTERRLVELATPDVAVREP